MKALLSILLLCGPLHAQVVRQNGINQANVAVTVSSITVSALNVGGVVFSSTPANGRLAVDASNLFWDDANNRLGIGTNAPLQALVVMSPGAPFTVIASSSAATAAFVWDTLNSNAAARNWSIMSENLVNGDFGIYQSVAKGGSALTNTPNPALYFSAARFVGLGTTSPASLLHLSTGTIIVDGSTTNSLHTAGHIVSSGTITSVVCNAGTPVVTVGSTDWGGSYLSGTAAVNCTVTFGRTWTKAPFCICSTNAAVPIALSATTVNTTTLVCTGAAALTGDTITYLCLGAP